MLKRINIIATLFYLANIVCHLLSVCISYKCNSLISWQGGTSLEGQDSHDSGLGRGHKGPVRPTCLGTARAGPILTLFYSYPGNTRVI
jgi:hypothetical protein